MNYDIESETFTNHLTNALKTIMGSGEFDYRNIALNIQYSVINKIKKIHMNTRPRNIWVKEDIAPERKTKEYFMKVENRLY